MTSPIIIVGCHRSGTTLLTQLLQDAGVFMGIKQDEHLEAAFFQNLNLHFFHRSGTKWFRPQPVLDNLEQEWFQAMAQYKIRRAFRYFQYRDYWGLANFVRCRILRPDTLWGWKDPRSTITLPLWLHRFPKARIIHIYRNGVDVARSLQVRDIQDKAMFPTLQTRCIELKGAFETWVEYETAALRLTAELPVLRIRYEDLLAEPTRHLQQLDDFLGRQLAYKIDADTFDFSKAYAFRHDAELMAFYEAHRDHPMMVRFGYDVLPT